MNFKDEYKSANDNIRGNRDLIDTIFEKAQKRKTHRINYYTFSSVAAAAILVFGIYSSQYVRKYITVPPKPVSDKLITVPPKPVSDKLISVSEDAQNKSDFNKSKVSEYETGMIEQALPENIPETKTVPVVEEPKSARQAPDIQVLPAPEEQTHNTEQEQLPEYPVESDISYDTGLPPADNTDCLPIASGGGSAGGAMKSFSHDNTNRIGKDEYFEYLGITPEDLVLVLPDGMVWEFPENYGILRDNETGEVINDTNSIVALDYNNPERVIVLSFTTDASVVSETFDNNNEKVMQTSHGKMYVFYGELNKEAFIEYDSVYITITSAGVSDEEFDTLLENIF